MFNARALRHSKHRESFISAAVSSGGFSWLLDFGQLVQIRDRGFNSTMKHLNTEVLVRGVQPITVEAVAHHDDGDFHHLNNVSHNWNASAAACEHRFVAPSFFICTRCSPHLLIRHRWWW